MVIRRLSVSIRRGGVRPGQIRGKRVIPIKAGHRRNRLIPLCYQADRGLLKHALCRLPFLDDLLVLILNDVLQFIGREVDDCQGVVLTLEFSDFVEMFENFTNLESLTVN